jgi:hypothetical protein
MILAYFLIFTFPSHGQNDNVESFWGMTIGLKSQKILDQVVSPVWYSGTNIFFNINHQRYRTKSISFFEIKSSIGSLNTRTFEPSQNGGRFVVPKSSFYWNEIAYTHLRKITTLTNGAKIYIGGNVSHLLSLRLNERWDSSMINYEGGGFLNASGLYSTEFTFRNKNLKGNFLLSLPAFGYLIRPEYVGVPNFINHEISFLNGFYGNGYFVSFFNFPRINSRIWIDYPIASGNRIQFGYEWDYYSFQNPHPVSATGHTFSLNFLLKTK